MSLDNGTHGSPEDHRKSKLTAKRRGAVADNVGKALRSAYDEALREDVPDDFLSLLGKLS